jgi:hypothetical protein
MHRLVNDDLRGSPLHKGTHKRLQYTVDSFLQNMHAYQGAIVLCVANNKRLINQMRAMRGGIQFNTEYNAVLRVICTVQCV